MSFEINNLRADPVGISEYDDEVMVGECEGFSVIFNWW